MYAKYAKLNSTQFLGQLLRSIRFGTRRVERYNQVALTFGSVLHSGSVGILQFVEH